MLISISGWCQSVTQLEGKYQGRNVYVSNPEYSEGDGFCVSKVEVNGLVYDFADTSAAFAIVLDSFDLAIGDPLLIRFTHEKGCSPRVLNFNSLTNQSLRINSGYQDDSVLYWKDEFEEDFIYQIEHYRWNKWIVVDLEIADANEESFLSAKLNSETHSGANTFRIVAINPIGMKGYSSNFMLMDARDPVSYDLDQNSKQLVFTSKTKYELYDDYGTLLQQRNSDVIDLSNLDKGIYFLNFDNYNSKIKLK